MKVRSAFFISDGTGITAEALGNSLLSQFSQTEFKRIVLPYIDSIEKAEKVVARINKALEMDDGKPVIFDTIVNHTIREIVSKCNGYMIDIFSTFLAPLETELEEKSSYSVGKSHSIVDNTAYKTRIDAVNYALENDDGARTFYYNKADIILVGVSRSGKTPTCLYLALQFGIYAANYPITDDDLEEMRLPKALREHKNKIFGLTIEPERLAFIRHERRPDSRYSSMKQCEREVHDLESLFRKERIPFLNTTNFSIEEISTKIMIEKEMERRA